MALVGVPHLGSAPRPRVVYGNREVPHTTPNPELQVPWQCATDGEFRVASQGAGLKNGPLDGSPNLKDRVATLKAVNVP